MERTIRRGDIYYAELNPVVGSEQGGIRPVLIISNDILNNVPKIGRCFLSSIVSISEYSSLVMVPSSSIARATASDIR